jgi:hypothetical protein
MKIAANSWHAKLYLSLEKGKPAPTVCMYWFDVLLLMPFFYAMLGILFVIFSPFFLIGWLAEKVNKRWPAKATPVNQVPLCPFGKIEFDDEEHGR